MPPAPQTVLADEVAKCTEHIKSYVKDQGFETWQQVAFSATAENTPRKEASDVFADYVHAHTQHAQPGSRTWAEARRLFREVCLHEFGQGSPPERAVPAAAVPAVPAP